MTRPTHSARIIVQGKVLVHAIEAQAGAGDMRE